MMVKVEKNINKMLAISENKHLWSGLTSHNKKLTGQKWLMGQVCDIPALHHKTAGLLQ
jgi:hypothetical protein